MSGIDIAIAEDEPCKAGNKGYSSAIPIGSVLRLCGDRYFTCVVTAVKFMLDCPAQYCVEWRDGRSIEERWMTLGEIQAYAKLEED